MIATAPSEPFLGKVRRERWLFTFDPRLKYSTKDSATLEKLTDYCNVTQVSDLARAG